MVYLVYLRAGIVRELFDTHITSAVSYSLTHHYITNKKLRFSIVSMEVGHASLWYHGIATSSLQGKRLSFHEAIPQAGCVLQSVRL